MTLRTTMLGLGLALVAGSAFALPPPPPLPPLPPPPPSPAEVIRDIRGDTHAMSHHRHYRHHHHRDCYRRNHGGHCVRWTRHR